MLDRLEELNAEYFDKFGCVTCLACPAVAVHTTCHHFSPRGGGLCRYIYIVCATGKSAGEMLAILESRQGNAPEEELAVAAREQSKITKIRLEKLLKE